MLAMLLDKNFVALSIAYCDVVATTSRRLSPKSLSS